MTGPSPRRGCRAQVLALVTAALGALVGACPERAPLPIGFLGGLTGRGADLGTAGRDGATLAVEEQNARGGLQGRRLTLLSGDDRQEPSTAVRELRRLLDEGVVAVVGPMTSAMAVATAPAVAERRVVMIAPTVATYLLTGQDDYFLRVYPTGAEIAARLAEVAAHQLRLTRVAVVYDSGNAAYTQTLYQSFTRAFVGDSSRVTRPYVYRSGPRPYFSELAAEIHATDADGVLVLSGAMDTALLCQHLRAVGSALPVMVTEWSATDEVIQHGGAAVEGMLLLQSVDRLSTRPESVRFRRAFAQRFGYAPSFAAVHAYDAARVLFAGLERTHEPSKLKAQLLAIARFEGLQGPLQLDRFGDVAGRYVLTTVLDGRFVAADLP